MGTTSPIVCVRNLSFQVTEAMLDASFRHFGTIQRIAFAPPLEHTRPLTRVAYIQFSTAEAAESACALHGVAFFEYEMKVEQCESQVDTIDRAIHGRERRWRSLCDRMMDTVKRLEAQIRYADQKMLHSRNQSRPSGRNKRDREHERDPEHERDRDRDKDRERDRQRDTDRDGDRGRDKSIGRDREREGENEAKGEDQSRAAKRSKRNHSNANSNSNNRSNSREEAREVSRIEEDRVHEDDPALRTLRKAALDAIQQYRATHNQRRST